LIRTDIQGDEDAVELPILIRSAATTSAARRSGHFKISSTEAPYVGEWWTRFSTRVVVSLLV
jgi:hypothetical protein